MNSGRLPLGTFLNPAPSCKHLPDNSSSGDYWIQNAGTGYASLEYCDMTRRCCDGSRGWMRVAHFDMTDPTHHCPRGFRYTFTHQDEHVEDLEVAATQLLIKLMGFLTHGFVEGSKLISIGPWMLFLLITTTEHSQ